jgi:hypothetical protein
MKTPPPAHLIFRLNASGDASAIPAARELRAGRARLEDGREAAREQL